LPASIDKINEERRKKRVTRIFIDESKKAGSFSDLIHFKPRAHDQLSFTDSFYSSFPILFCFVHFPCLLISELSAWPIPPPPLPEELKMDVDEITIENGRTDHEVSSVKNSIPRKRRFNKKQIFCLSLLQILLLFGLFMIGWYLGFVGHRPLLADKILNDGHVPDITVDEIDNLYDLFAEAAARLDEWGIEYWLLGGSLIGATRNQPGGPMKWDDDHDIGIFEDQVEELDSYFANSSSFDVSTGGFGYQFRLRDMKDRKVEKYFQFDIFVFKRDGKGEYRIQDTDMWPKSYYKNKEEVLPAETCYLWDIKTKCPRLAVDLLKREFADDVLYSAVKYDLFF
jgi:hypothetical protein